MEPANIFHTQWKIENEIREMKAASIFRLTIFIFFLGGFGRIFAC